jgi:hypothetical protein
MSQPMKLPRLYPSRNTASSFPQLLEQSSGNLQGLGKTVHLSSIFSHPPPATTTTQLVPKGLKETAHPTCVPAYPAPTMSLTREH